MSSGYTHDSPNTHTNFRKLFKQRFNRRSGERGEKNPSSESLFLLTSDHDVIYHCGLQGGSWSHDCVVVGLSLGAQFSSPTMLRKPPGKAFMHTTSRDRTPLPQVAVHCKRISMTFDLYWPLTTFTLASRDWGDETGILRLCGGQSKRSGKPKGNDRKYSK